MLTKVTLINFALFSSALTFVKLINWLNLRFPLAHISESRFSSVSIRNALIIYLISVKLHSFKFFLKLIIFKLELIFAIFLAFTIIRRFHSSIIEIRFYVVLAIIHIGLIYSSNSFIQKIFLLEFKERPKSTILFIIRGANSSHKFLLSILSTISEVLIIILTKLCKYILVILRNIFRDLDTIRNNARCYYTMIWNLRFVS